MPLLRPFPLRRGGERGGVVDMTRATTCRAIQVLKRRDGIALRVGVARIDRDLPAGEPRQRMLCHRPSAVRVMLNSDPRACRRALMDCGQEPLPLLRVWLCRGEA